jgi:hypothetical protein
MALHSQSARSFFRPVLPSATDETDNCLQVHAIFPIRSATFIEKSSLSSAQNRKYIPKFEKLLLLQTFHP